MAHRPGRGVAAAALLLLLVAAAAPSQAIREKMSDGGSRRSLLDSRPCCDDCKNRNSDAATFYCFQNCRQDCVSGSDCLQLSRDVAGKVADVACNAALQRCSATKAVTVAGFQVTRKQCYKAAKNVCLTYGHDYAQGGGGSCYGYNNGVGSCDASTFRQYFESELNDLCESVGRGIAIALP